MRAWTTGREPYESTLEFLKNPENLGLLSEGIAADHLVRLAFLLCEQKQLFAYENMLLYWRGKKDREVDFVMRECLPQCCAIEVKYQPTINRKDIYSIVDFKKVSGASSFPNGIILSKETLEVRRNVTILPIWLFLLIV
jgi:predicted AAA+ superfamily ATPase